MEDSPLKMLSASKMLCCFMTLVIVVLASCAAPAPATAPLDKSDAGAIRIGFVGPLTGDAVHAGLTEKNALEVALDDINRTIAGRQVEVLYEDGHCTAEGGLTAAKKLVEIDGVGIIFSVCSSESLAIASYVDGKDVLQLTAWASNPAITRVGGNVFRTSYSDDDVGRMMAEAIAPVVARGGVVGIISEETAYAAGVRSAFVRYFNRSGGEVISESFAQNSQDMRTQVTKLLAHDPQAIIVNPDSPVTGIAVLKQLHEIGYSGPLFGNFFGGSASVQYLPEAQGMIFFADPVVGESPLKAHLLDAYTRRFGEAPAFEFPAVSRYDDVFLLKQAIEAVGSDPAAIRGYLYTMSSFTGALGTFHFNDRGDMVGVEPSVKRIINQSVILVEPRFSAR